MPIHAYDAGAMKKLKEVHAYDGGVMKKLKEVWIWDTATSSFKKIFSGVNKYEFYTNFDSLSAGRLITVDSGNWYDSPAGSIVPTVVAGGTVRTNTTGTDGTYSTWCVHSTPANSDNFEVEIRMAEGWNGYVSGLLVGSNAAMTQFGMLQLTTATGGQGIFIGKDGAYPASSGYSGVSGASNDIFTLRKTVSGGVGTYTGFKNGVQFAQLVDSTPHLPGSASTHRYGGMVFTFRRSFFNNYFSAAFTDFRIKDL